MLMKLMLKRILPTVAGIVAIVLACMWLYGFLGVKFGWIGMVDKLSLNCISRNGADFAD